MKREYKIKFDHSKEKFGETVDVSDDRLHEIKDIVYHAVTNMSKCDEQHTKSEVLETIKDDIDPQTIAEVFLTGCCFGVLEYMAKEQSKQKYDKEAMLNAIKNMKEDISPLLDVDKFIYAMKNEENDF